MRRFKRSPRQVMIRQVLMASPDLKWEFTELRAMLACAWHVNWPFWEFQ